MTSPINIVLDPDFPVIVIDVSMLFYNVYYQTLTTFFLANGDNRLAYREMMKEIRSLNAPDLATFKILAANIVRRGDKINYSEIYKNGNFMLLFRSVIERSIKKIYTSVTNASYKYGNTILINDCRRADNWRRDQFKFYKDTRTSRDIVTNYLNFNGKVVEEFWKSIFSVLKNSLGIRVLNIPTLEADDLAYFIKLKVRELLPTTELIIITRDYDYLQLVDEKTSIFNFEGINLNTRGFGSPQLNLVMKIMTGDASDNISPIFYGCGEKTAEKILEQLYPEYSENITQAASKFIEDIQNIDNVSNVATNIMTILDLSRARVRGRPISLQRMPTLDSLKNNLRANILLIQMEKIPNHFREQFNNTYNFTTYELGVQKFEQLVQQREQEEQNRQRLAQLGYQTGVTSLSVQKVKKPKVKGKSV